MEKIIDCMGMACPLPVITAKKAIESFTEDGTLHVKVDNDTAVQNLTRLGERNGFTVTSVQNGEKEYTVTMQVKVQAAKTAEIPVEAVSCTVPPKRAFLTTEDPDTIRDLKNLAEAGATVMTCGTCLDFYGLKEKLQVGIVSNMYDIVEA